MKASVSTGPAPAPTLIPALADDVWPVTVLTVPTVITLDGTGLTVSEVARIAAGEPVELDPAAVARADRGWRIASEVAAGQPVYGRTTGVGANREVDVPPHERASHGRRLLASHAAAAGDVLPAPLVRAMLAVRVNQLAVGSSGIRPDVLTALTALLGSDSLPTVRDGGSIGTGDLTALGQVGLSLPVALDGGDALALMSSNALTLARAALAVVELDRLARAGLVVTALTVRAVDGAISAFSETVHAARPHPGQRRAAGALRELLVESGVWEPARVQDDYGVRAAAQVAGPLFDAIDRASTTITVDVNAGTENPMIDVAERRVLHHASFHLAALSVDLDAVRLALYQAAALSAARVSMLMEPKATGLTSFLASDPPGSSGALVLEYAAQGALATVRHAAAPTTLGTATVSRGVEDHAPFAPEAARQLGAAITAAREVTACEVVAAVRALRLRGVAVGGRLGTAFDELAPTLDAEMADRDLGPDLRAAIAELDGLSRYVTLVGDL
jgi:histidine ammonia-lyase